MRIPNRFIIRMVTAGLLTAGLLAGAGVPSASADPVQCIDVYDAHGNIVAHICLPVP